MTIGKMSKRVCPHWVGYLLANPLRRFVHNPDRILAPFVTGGMTVLDVGPGMGFFTLPLAKRVGPAGKVICVDVQESMLRSLQKRAATSQLADRILLRVGKSTSLCLSDFDGRIDFALAFAVVHEIPDISNFFAELSKALKPGALCLIAEPKWHVSGKDFEATLIAAMQKSLIVAGKPEIARCHTALLKKVS
jgi:ubiquinone/menaquinone biosynthesis C-methylase UbiE